MQLLAWTLRSCGIYFRTLYRAGVFLQREDAQIVVESGWKMLDPRFI